MEARIDLRRTERYRPWTGRGPALVLAIVLTLVLVLLASAVFSIAGRSRDVASRSVALHSLNETLRAATVVRAQVTFAAYLAENDRRYGTDSRDDLRVATREARRNLNELEPTLSQTRFAGTLDDETRAALARFTAAADRALVVASSSQPAGARAVVSGRLVPSFVVLRDRIVSLRDDALHDVRKAGSLLGRLGGLASFVIAFVLPTIAVLVYRQVMRRSRESTELARSLALERGRSNRRRQLLARSLGELQAGLAHVEAAGEDARAPILRRLGWEVEALSTVITGAHRLAFADVELDGELVALAAELREAGIDVGVTAAEGVAWADPTVLGAALRNLVLEAQSAGARRIELEARAGGEHVEVTVAHDGAELTPALVSLVFERSHDDERTAVEAGAAPICLLAAQDLIEAIEGSLAPATGPGRPAYVARLPRARGLRTPDPTTGGAAVPVHA